MKYDNPRVGPTVRMTEASVEIDGHSVLPCDLLEAARCWRQTAEQKGWKLRDAYGREIATEHH